MFHKDSAIAIVGTDAQEVAITFTRSRVHELVANVISEAEGIQDIFPICALENEGFSVLRLPLIDGAAPTPPGIEVNILDATDVIDGVNENTPPAAAGPQIFLTLWRSLWLASIPW